MSVGRRESPGFGYWGGSQHTPVGQLRACFLDELPLLVGLWLIVDRGAQQLAGERVRAITIQFVEKPNHRVRDLTRGQLVHELVQTVLDGG